MNFTTMRSHLYFWLFVWVVSFCQSWNTTAKNTQLWVPLLFASDLQEKSFSFTVVLQVSAMSVQQGQYLTAYLTSYIQNEKGHAFAVSFHCWNTPHYIIDDPGLHKSNSQHNNALYTQVSRSISQSVKEGPTKNVVHFMNITSEKCKFSR